MEQEKMTRNRITASESLENGEEILKREKLLEKVEMAAREWEQKNSRQNNLKYMGWEQGHEYHVGEEKYEFEARKEKIFIKHDTGDRLRNLWNLIGIEIAYRNRDLEAAAWLIPAEGENTIEDLKDELEEEIFRKYIPLQVPLYIIEYKKKEEEQRTTGQGNQ